MDIADRQNQSSALKLKVKMAVSQNIPSVIMKEAKIPAISQAVSWMRDNALKNQKNDHFQQVASLRGWN
jgi:hypothetical protein